MTEVFELVWSWLSSPVWRFWLGAILVAVGGISTALAAVGVLRFPDFYTRMHAASVTDTLGAMSVLVGLALLAPSFIIVFKLGMIGVFIFLTSPTATHAIANAAYTAGLHPLVGSIDEITAEADEEKAS